MKYAILTNTRKRYKEIILRLQNSLPKTFEEVETNPEVVFCVGGDGTFLSSVRTFSDNNPVYVNINNGTLGFYSEFSEDEIETVIKKLTTSNFQTKQLPLIETVINGKKITALNEISITAMNNTVRCNVHVNGKLLNHFRGTGIVVGTQMGSTGLSKSLGGAVVLPGIDIMQIMEMAPINNNTYRSLGSPLITTRDSIIELKDIHQLINVHYDGENIIQAKDCELKIYSSKNKVRVMMGDQKNRNHINKLRRAFIQN